MRLLFPAILLLASCSSSPNQELASTKWQLYSITGEPGRNLDSIDSMFMKAFTEDTSYRVYADFDSKNTITVIINNSESKDTTISNYSVAGDTLFLLYKDQEGVDTFLVKSSTEEMLQVNSINGMIFKFKSIR